MKSHTDHYAYRAEAALAHFVDGLQIRHEPHGRERLACGLFARAARGALVALCAAQALPADESALNLLSPVDCLDRHRKLFGRQTDKAFFHARLLSRVLILDQHDAGSGYVTRDLYDADDVFACEEAARFFIDWSCRRLLRCTCEQALGRLHPFRTAPMTHTALWERRSQSGSPGRSSR